MRVKNVSYIGQNFVVSNGTEYIIINDYKIEVPKKLQNKSKTIINNKVYIGGYEYKNGTWKKTFKAFLKTYF